MATKKKDVPAADILTTGGNPLMASLRENDKKNLFKTNVTTAFHKTGFPVFDYYFGAVINIHDENGVMIRQEPRVGQAAGTFNLIVGNTGSGKAQPVDTIIPTPDGDRMMGDLKAGDKVFGSDGYETEVLGVYPQGMKDVYEIEFMSGKKTKCCGEHLWNIRMNCGTPMTVTTEQIIDKYLYADVPALCTPLYYKHKNVPVDPYVVGAIYSTAYIDADGFVYTTDKRVAQNAAKRMNCIATEVFPGRYALSSMMDVSINRNGIPTDYLDFNTTCKNTNIEDGIPGIPKEYMENDSSTRWNLISGIFDTCGNIEAGACACTEVIVTCRLPNLKVANDVLHVLKQFGFNAELKVNSNNYIGIDENAKLCIEKEYIIDCEVPAHVINEFFIRPDKKMVALQYRQLITSSIKPDKVLRDDEVRDMDLSWIHTDRILSVTKLPEQMECVCIKVAAKDELYVTEDCIITHNTTLGSQITANIIRPYEYANAIHFDCENRFDISRCETITHLPAWFFDGSRGGERYIIRNGMIGLDTIQEMIVKTYVTKMKLKKELMVPSGFKDEFGKDVMIFQPTVILADSMTTIMNETFSPDNAKDAADAEKMRGNTEGARDAKTLKGFFKDILPLCKEANIIVYGINHLNTNMSMNAFIPVAKQQNYLKQDEIIPGGKTMIYYPFNIIKLTAKPSDDFTEEGDGFAGHMVMVEPIKSSSNQSGNNSKGISFEMVFSHKQGFDSLRTMIMYARNYGIIEGNKTRMKFKDDDSFTFALKTVYKEKAEKPIWESIKKFVIPHLLTHLSFVEPLETEFDERSMDY